MALSFCFLRRLFAGVACFYVGLCDTGGGASVCVLNNLSSCN